MYVPDVPTGLWVVSIKHDGKVIQSMALGYLKAKALYEKRCKAARLINGRDDHIRLVRIVADPATK